MAKLVRRKSEGGKLCVRLTLQFAPSTIAKLSGLTYRTRVSTLKTRTEQDLGILPEMYHLSYLDAAPLDEALTLKDHDVINGATLTLRPWRMWAELLKTAYFGETKECLACSVDVRGASEWNRHCAWIALYIASHRGHYGLAARLLETTCVEINTQSPCGWTALHAAARMGRWKVLCVLVDNGADVRIRDRQGMSAFDLARHYGHKKCEQSLNFCQWNLQKQRIVQERQNDYDAKKARANATRQAHQFRDSTLRTWIPGSHGRIYLIQPPNPVRVGEVLKFEPRDKRAPTLEPLPNWRPVTDFTVGGAQTRATQPSSSVQHLRSTPSLPAHRTMRISHSRMPVSHSRSSTATCVSSKVDHEVTGKKLDFNYGWFDPLRAQQLIPSTHDILTYSDPSSCRLHPQSLLNPQGYKTPPTGPAGKARASVSLKHLKETRKPIAHTV